jgi:mannobiose 2-epimerase
MAGHGMRYLERVFLDRDNGGWHWSAEAGEPKDRAKLMYGQSFALYGLCAYAALGDKAAGELAVATFDAMHQAADLAHGGFWENLGPDWSPEPTESGRRKSLDIHLHLLESFTSLAALTGSAAHLRKLAEIRQLVLAKMVDPATGAGGNQYSADFTPLQPIVIGRTWIAERLPGQVDPPGQLTTSYAHNLELGWLLGKADAVLGADPAEHAALVDRIAEHTLAYGFDHERGGVYREGPPLGAATDTDKEFWQNAEALVGFLHAYQLTGKPRYAEAFALTWDFAKRFLIHPTLAEWRIRTTRTGAVLDAWLGNQWTGGYHTVRSAIECAARLAAL